MYELDIEHNTSLVPRPSPSFSSVKQWEAGRGPGNEANIAQLLSCLCMVYLSLCVCVNDVFSSSEISAAEEM